MAIKEDITGRERSFGLVFSDEIQGFWLGEEVQPLLALYILQTHLTLAVLSTHPSDLAVESSARAGICAPLQVFCAGM